MRSNRDYRADRCVQIETDYRVDKCVQIETYTEQYNAFK